MKNHIGKIKHKQTTIRQGIYLRKVAGRVLGRNLGLEFDRAKEYVEPLQDLFMGEILLQPWILWALVLVVKY
jgi:hypothetical protein